MIQRLLVSFALVVLFAALPAAAQNDERILSFHSDATVQADGTLRVEETIRVRARGDRIKRGIYRDFPTLYGASYGPRTVVGFVVLEVRRDAEPEDHHIEKRTNGVRIYLGRADRLLPPGEYTYTLVYRTTRQLGFFESHDELYWNVTGNGWVFPIDQAMATVRLPAGIPPDRIKIEAYTGPQGATGRNYTAELDPEGRAHFRTTAPLAAYEGLTIVVGWPKGYVVQPTPTQEKQEEGKGKGKEDRSQRVRGDTSVDDEREVLFVGVGGLAVVFLYYLIVWLLVGRDPARGTIVTLYEPPGGYSPAGLRYLTRMGFDDRAFAASLLNMAVKGYLTIRREAGVYSLAPTGVTTDVLAPEEQKIAETLLPSGQPLELKDDNCAAVSSARNASMTSLQHKMKDVHFHTNTGYFLIGLGVSAVVALALIPRLLFTSALVAPLGALGAVNLLFYHLLKAPTSRGRALLDKVEGFKQFLAAVEADRLERIGGPEITPPVFEKYLPYAVALGVEQAWAKKFSNALAAAGQAPSGDGGYSPSWYSGESWGSLGAAGFASSIGDSFSGAIYSASNPPGSSSGFSDSGSGSGGSSGGGGGGGGGGGW